MNQESIIYIQKPSDKTKLLQLLNNVPASVLASDYKAVLWLDDLRRVADSLKCDHELAS